MQNTDAYKLPTLGSYNEGPLKIIKEGPKREMSMKVSIFKLGFFFSLGENINSREIFLKFVKITIRFLLHHEKINTKKKSV